MVVSPSASSPDSRSHEFRGLGASVGPDDFEMARRKKPSAAISAAYRIKRLATDLLGPRRVLRMCLDTSWLLKRFAFELSGLVYGSDFHDAALALSESFLVRWLPAGGSVIDIGCGHGRWSRAAARHVRRVVGIDRSEQNLARARAQSVAGIEYVHGDVEAMLGGEHFDVALMVHLLEHVDDVDTLLRTVRRISSRLIIEVPDFESDCLNVVRRATGSPWYSDADHVREYTLATLHLQLQRNGWRIEHHEHRGGSILAVVRHASSEA